MSSEPVLVALTVPARRSLVDGLVVAPGSAPAGRVIDADAEDAEIADILAEAAHSDTGLIARTAVPDRALAMVAGTAAALCGEDIRTALTTPDIAFLTGLNPQAIEAVRGVLLAIETEYPDQLGRALGEVLRPVADR
ncbi:hypothetical protein GV794_22535 [Nocardia cyriacigeorgica]|uniref:Uncharacterized protein n=1 Tax=Nocardia cyriacigeorgica TaxID=135487 RepID=A0A6P1D499_9NOCA|nr:hypothetical protein [Nocardia cyriacigeorgica]NEW38294.1 hypothetical protein [Nocardia cyriacigeorgica]NEW44359.1 hypothetical protein [Nocardia cyriacigeorgica]NEW49237.1 hypothetical protein [Nocardia cyriacigeorgica]NEW58403.1 hypothetical protein [Nocardia cyriacigeorgica]